MRALMLGAVLCAAVVGSAHAAECRSGSADILRLTSWAAEPSKNGTSVTITYENTGSKPLRMAEATAWFRDALGRSIGGIPLNEDITLAPGETATETARMLGMERLTIAARTDISATICTVSALFADGAVERFDQPPEPPAPVSLADQIKGLQN